MYKLAIQVPLLLTYFIVLTYLLNRVLDVDLSIATTVHARWMNGVCPLLSSASFKNYGLNDSGSLSVDIEGIQHPLLLEVSLKRLSDQNKQYLIIQTSQIFI